MTADSAGPRLFGRRGACLLLAGAALAGPALADDTPETAPAPALPMPQITPPAPSAPAPHPAAAAATAVDKSKIYYLFFNQQIDAATMRTLRRDLTTLVEAGVAQINLVLSSPGGAVDQTLITYGFIRSLPVMINTHAQGFVASAATILFLAGEERSADRSARFLFHPSQTVVPGSVNGQQLHERLTLFDAMAEVIGSIYKDRTTLSDADIERFTQSEVIYDAEQALAHGVVQAVADLKLPSPQVAKIQFVE